MSAVVLTSLSTGGALKAQPMITTWIHQPHARPRYRAECPLLWRAPGLAQLGEGRLHRILPLRHGEAQWLLGLDGLRTVEQLLAEREEAGLSESQAQSLLLLAASAGALDDAGAIPEAWRLISTREREVAQGDHAAALLTLGSCRLADEALNLRHRTSYAITVDGRPAVDSHLASLLHLSLQAAGLTSEIDPSRAQLQVLLGLHPVIGAEVAALEMARPSGAHLFVAAYGDRGVVGPLVVPGQTSCLRCAYLHTRDADPSWAGVSIQLHAAISRLIRPPVDRLLAFLLAAQAGRLARTWVDSAIVVGRWHDLALEIRLPEGSMHEQARPAHALCDCRWLAEGVVSG